MLSLQHIFIVSLNYDLQIVMIDKAIYNDDHIVHQNIIEKHTFSRP